MNHKVFSLWALVGSLSLLGAARAAEERGYLGVFLSPIPEVLTAHVGVKEGALIESVQPESPAEKGGLHRFDVIVALNGEKVKGPDDARKRIQSTKAGDSLKLSLKRGADSLDLQVTLGSVPSSADLPKEPEAEPLKEKEEAKQGFLGVGYAEVPPILGGHLGLSEGSGVLVGDVWKDSPAAKAGIEKDDILTAVDGYEVKGSADFLRLLSEKKAGDEVKIDLIHKGAKKSVILTLADRPQDLSWPNPQPGDRLFSPDGHGAFKNFRFFGPGSRRGRLILEGPEGTEHVIPLPDSVWKLGDVSKEIEDQLKKLHELTQPGALNARVKKLMEELDHKLHEEGVVGNESLSESHSAVIRIVEGDHDITLRDQNGKRTVTVKRGDKVLCDKLPYDQINTLPKEVQEKVEKAAESLKETRPVEVPKDSKIKA